MNRSCRDRCGNGVERRKTGSPEYIHSTVVKLSKLPNGEELQKKNEIARNFPVTQRIVQDAKTAEYCLGHQTQIRIN